MEDVSRRKEKVVKISTPRIELQANYHFVRDSAINKTLDKKCAEARKIIRMLLKKKKSALLGFISQLWKYHSFPFLISIDIVIKL